MQFFEDKMLISQIATSVFCLPGWHLHGWAVACMALGGTGTFGLKPLLGCVWLRVQPDGVVWFTPSAQQAFHCW